MARGPLQAAFGRQRDARATPDTPGQMMISEVVR
jgi:hypothetical protein